MGADKFYQCTECNSIYLTEQTTASNCSKCGQVQLKGMEGRFILRCKKCGLTQNKRAFVQIHGQDPLRCQSSTCNGPIKSIFLGGRKKKTKGKLAHPAVPGRRGGLRQTQARTDDAAPKPDANRLRSVLLSPKEAQNMAPVAKETIHTSVFTAFPSASPSEAPKLKDHPGLRAKDCLNLNGIWYQVIGKIGTGGMGAVHEAKNLKTGESIAIKEFYYSRFHDPESGGNHCEKYWEREAHISDIQTESKEKSMKYIGKLKLELFNLPEYYIFLEHLKGVPFDTWYTSRYSDLSKLTITDLRMIILDLLMPICRHMYYVAEKGIVHRDLTVQNIMIQEESPGKFYPIVIDWGVAKEIGVENLYNPRKPYYVASAPEATGIRNRGTPPEVMAGFQPIAATDIYMLGHIMFYIFSGGHYCGTAATNEDFVLHPADFNPDLPADFNKMVEWMTQYEPADRMENMIKVYSSLKWLYEITESMENSEKAQPKYFITCEYNGAKIELPMQQVLRLSRENFISAGTNHDYDGHLFHALIPAEEGKFQFEFYLDGGYLYIRDLHSVQGTFLTFTNVNMQQYSNVNIKGLNNCVVPLMEQNFGTQILEVPFQAPDGIIYRIPFSLVME